MENIQMRVACMKSSGYKAVISGEWKPTETSKAHQHYIVPRGTSKEVDQPRKGFEAPMGAIEWWDNLPDEQRKAELTRASLVEGTHISKTSRIEIVEPELAAA